MINSENFIKRLKKIMEYYGESAASFSEKINVQRSSISHILSGRNKPSLEFILKILNAFPEIDLYWLLNGKGVFPKVSEEKIASPSTPLTLDFPTQTTQSNSQVKNKYSSDKRIERIVIFYSDGSFENFEN